LVAAARIVGDSASSPERPASESVGAEIGPYRLVEQIGEGTFGVVFLAEQERPVKRRVALKIIKAGMDTRRFVARFQAERQTLAAMNHPNIARVIDGGATEMGRPYFVMEYVQGEPITAYADRHTLNLRSRLELFISVCEAIQHAHQRGIIHRDIKPNNILVTELDGRATPKVIDFGIAKSFGPMLTEGTSMTERGQLVGTPEYMSPEQAAMGAAEIDTRADVYSLGVVLYELIAGVLPFDWKALRIEGLGEVLKSLRETDPPRPSTRLSTVDAAKATEIAANRESQQARLTRELSRELEWIPMKALRKAPGERYQSPRDMAEDIGRYLRGEALEAGPEAVGYRLRKFVRRNRGAVGAVAGVMVVHYGAIAILCRCFPPSSLHVAWYRPGAIPRRIPTPRPDRDSSETGDEEGCHQHRPTRDQPRTRPLAGFASTFAAAHVARDSCGLRAG
ncbi:MAG: serine/threonine-protein kinase, partial [Phycisphaerales bacterium]